MSDELVPIFLFLTIGLVLFFYFYFNYKNRSRLQETLREAVGKGMELTPEVLETLTKYAVPKTNDFRRGVLLIAFGVAVALFGLVIDRHVEEVTGLSLFPLLLGCGYLFVWKMDPAGKKT